MANPQELKQQALGKINGAMTALEIYPKSSTTNTQSSINLSTNPIEMLLDIFKATNGYDWIIDTVSKYIAYGIPVLEVAVKGILLTNIQNILTCSIIPLITRNIVRDGVVFDVHQIDLLNIFNYSPIQFDTTNPGRYYYFGCEGFTIEDEVKYSDDLNAVLWYAINHPTERVVWKTKETRLIDNCIEENENKKHTKNYGIVTFEYSPRSSALKNYEGNQFSTQEPISSCLHCFVGCADRYKSPTEESIRDEISTLNAKLDTLNNFFAALNGYKIKVDKEYREKVTNGKRSGEDTDYFVAIENVKNNDLETIKNVEELLRNRGLNDTVPSSIILNIVGTSGETVLVPQEFVGTPTIGTNEPLCYNTIINEKFAVQATLATVGQGSYPRIEDNYYYKHLLMEFNTDFILNTKLFDEKVVTARLIDAIIGGLDMSVNLSLEEKMIRAQIRNMVERILESDDTVVSDCFFAFTNEQYDSMLQETEMARIGINMSYDTRTSNPATAEEILSMLDNISQDATKEEIQSTVKGMLFSAVSSTNPVGSDEYTYDLNVNLIENLLTQLMYVIVTVIISPKVYILLMMNLKLMGHEPNFDLKKFIDQFKQLIAELIRSVRDQIIQFFYDEIMKLLQEIFSKLSVQVALEQYKYYVELLTHCLDCLKFHANEYDWAQDMVQYADITDVSQITNEEC